MRGKLLSTYPFFYAFFFSVFAGDVAWSLGYSFLPIRHSAAFWASDFLSLFLGCGIVFETLRHTLSPYRGAQRFARTLGVLVFTAVFCLAVGYSISTRGALATHGTYFELERDFLAVQAIFIFAALVVITRYAIPLGRNVKGIVLGYGLCTGGSLVFFALRSQIGVRFDAWMFAERLSYDVSLLIWTVALWSLHRNPVARSSVQFEADYELLDSHARRALDATRSYVARAAGYN
ncbi:MAG: hypothetical protein ACRD4R_04130 [Candidatus Acidiferrales bacterium]